MSSLCILTPDPTYSERWQGDAEAYRALLGDDVDFCAWTQLENLGAPRLILPLLAWGYHHDPARWSDALDQLEAWRLPVANPVSLLRWNTDKAYLLDLEMAGVAIVPTRFAPALCADDLRAAGADFGPALVIKPSLSAGAFGTYRITPEDPVPADVAGQVMLIQPEMAAIRSEGEYSLFYFGGALSHCIIKRPAKGDFRVQPQHGGKEESVPAPAAARELAQTTLDVLPEKPLYARIDMIRDASGAFALMELEIIEPALFLHMAEDGGAALRAAILKAMT